jgi:hypothetical protein
MGLTKNPRVNNLAPDFSSITIYIQGKPFYGVTSINYKVTRDPGKVKGTAPRVLARTKGEFTFEGGFTMNKEDAADFRKQLGPGYMEKDFDVTVVYKPKGGKLEEDKLLGCCIIDDGDSHSSGVDPLVSEFGIDMLDQLRNGVSPISAD